MDENTPKRAAQRANKPLTEKKRRLRINASLEQIKCLIMDALGQDPASIPTKFEKADVLELAVRYLQNQRLSGSPSGADPVNQYREGYQACIRDVTSYLSQANGGESNMKGSVLEHLDQCYTNLNSGSIIDMVRSQSVAPSNSGNSDFVDGPSIAASVMQSQPLQDLNQNIVQHQGTHMVKIAASQGQTIVQNFRENPVHQQNGGASHVRVPHAQLQFEHSSSNTVYATQTMLGLPSIQSFAPVPISVYEPLMETEKVAENGDDTYQTFTVLQPVKQERIASDDAEYYGLYHQDQGYV